MGFKCGVRSQTFGADMSDPLQRCLNAVQPRSLATALFIVGLVAKWGEDRVFVGFLGCKMSPQGSTCTALLQKDVCVRFGFNEFRRASYSSGLLLRLCIGNLIDHQANAALGDDV